MDSETATVLWREAVGVLRAGRAVEGAAKLQALYQASADLPAQLKAEITHSYAVALLIEGTEVYAPATAAQLFRELLETRGFGSERFGEASVRAELGAALLAVGDGGAAAAELERAVEAHLAAGQPTRIARLQLATAQRLGGRLEAARQSLAACRAEARDEADYAHYGIACEQEARLLLDEGKPGEAGPWLAQARWFYQSFAPHHFYNWLDLEHEEAAPFGGGEPVAVEGDGEFLTKARAAAERSRSGRLSVLDVDLLSLLRMSREEGRPIWAWIPIATDDPELRGRIARSIVAELQALWLRPSHLELVPETATAKRLGVTAADLPRALPLIGSEMFEDLVEPGTVALRWEAEHAWPPAFSVPLAELGLIFALSYESARSQAAALRRAGYEAPIQVPLYAQSLPTRLLARWWDLGAQASGQQVAPASFTAQLLEAALLDPEENLGRLLAMGYAPEEAQQLHDGGMIGVPWSMVGSWTQNLGGLPVDEVNVANLPAKPGRPDLEEIRAGYLFDSQYATPFIARKPGDHALHGKEPAVLRDHFEELNQAISPLGHLRLKHYAAPIVAAHSWQELRDLVGLLRGSRGTGEVYFRGQGRGWPLPRTPLVQRLLHGRTGLEEPSLPGAATRHGVHYESVHSLLSLVVQDLLFSAVLERGEDPEETHRRWREMRMTPGWELDVAVMAFAQHYGIPSDGLDLTTSLEVAVWFAVNRWQDLGEGRARYQPRTPDDWPSDARAWPVVYFIAPVTNSIKPSVRSIAKLAELGLELVRPQRQEALFFMGAHSHHRNRLAEAVAAAVVLAPGEWETGLTQHQLFPPPDQDPAYAGLLRARQHWQHLPAGQLLSRVVEYV
ncbi:MAG TPA: FRG domain-containing protein [Thermoanaerobaculia bacterium]|nr:FRG domain-containing protein [Thermoanaerobaculia bacterium]